MFSQAFPGGVLLFNASKRYSEHVLLRSIKQPLVALLFLKGKMHGTQPHACVGVHGVEYASYAAFHDARGGRPQQGSQTYVRDICDSLHLSIILFMIASSRSQNGVDVCRVPLSPST